MNMTLGTRRILTQAHLTLFKRERASYPTSTDSKPRYVIWNNNTRAITFQCNNIRTARAWLRNNRA